MFFELLQGYLVYSLLFLQTKQNNMEKQIRKPLWNLLTLKWLLKSLCDSKWVFYLKLAYLEGKTIKPIDKRLIGSAGINCTA